MVRALRSCASNERWSACAGAMIVSRRQFLEAASAMPAAALASSGQVSLRVVVIVYQELQQ